MAACGEISEPGRPPDHVFDSNYNREDRVTKSLLNFHSSNCRQTFRTFFKRGNAANGNNNNTVEDSMNNKNVDDEVAKGRALITTVSQAVDESRARKRYSFHQDVEEALNSLLWQPYEYQQSSREKTTSSYSCSSTSNSNSSDSCYDHRTSLCSSSCSSLSSASGLESTNNGTNRSGNTADLHLLVNNLRPHRLGQSVEVQHSRDLRKCELRASSDLPSAVNAQHLSVVEPARRSEKNAFAGSHWDVLRSPTDTMRVEIQPPSIKSIVTNGNNTTGGHNNASASSGGGAALLLQPDASIPPPPRSTRPTARNLSSVNVVGLPHNHPRQNSVPATLTVEPTVRTLVPNHSRNISEPYRGVNSFISSPVVNPLPRISSNAPSGNIVSLFNHQRLNSTPGAINGHPAPATSGDLLGVVRTTNNTRVPLNVSNVNVNYYRAVPVNVVSAVPTIQCLNTSGGGSGIAATSCTNATSTASIGTITDSNNVSNVNIVQAMPIVMPTLGGGPTATTTCTEVIVHSSAVITTPIAPQPVEVVRTFTSTEAQTDDTIMPPPEATTASREQRRRERRERRHQRRLNVANHRHVAGVPVTPSVDTASSNPPGQMPDLLNNTLPPPYIGPQHHAHQQQLTHPHPPPTQPGNIIVPPGTIVQSLVRNSLVPNGLVPNTMVPFHPQVVPGQVPLVQPPGAIPVPVPSPTGFRFPLPANGFRRSRFAEDPPKSCCGLLAWRPGSLRWFIALIALVAVCCVLVGTALGAMGPSGRDHLTVSLLMIGVGIILVTVSGVAWRLTSHDSSTCRSMLGLGSTESVEACPRRFVPRLPPSYGRPHHPYAAMMYPEFQYRPPPPSYQASMQEYRLRLLLLDRGSTPQIQAGLQNAVSPPPTYRSHSGSLLRVPLSNRRDATQSEYSCPPSYRSQNSSARAAAVLQNNSIMHSREQSLSLSDSNPDGSVVNVVNILSTNEEDISLDTMTLDSLKLEPDEINPLKMLLKGSNGDLEGTKHGNLVTIVQTNDQSPVIVTVSGSSHGDNQAVTEIQNEMEILAHL